ncbi:MAG: hypothetical protein KAW17_01180 [Candidatus Eisenbacteria sp.]|nr:hypothetical protein [Candidatus Eisenbacteria bacterium]
MADRHWWHLRDAQAGEEDWRASLLFRSLAESSPLDRMPAGAQEALPLFALALEEILTGRGATAAPECEREEQPATGHPEGAFPKGRP